MNHKYISLPFKIHFTHILAVNSMSYTIYMLYREIKKFDEFKVEI